MSAETNKAIALRIYEAFNTRNLKVLDMLVHPDFVDYYPGPEQKPGIEGIRKVWTQIWARFPNVHIVVEDLLAEGDKVATRLTLQHITPDSKEVTSLGRVFEIFRVVDGKVLELWNARAHGSRPVKNPTLARVKHELVRVYAKFL